MLITDFPVELLLDHVLPTLDLTSLLSLSQTCKFFAVLCSDDTFWRLKLHEDYNFSPNADTARESGWKVIYRGIRKPSVYTWGVAGQGRLGIGSVPREYSSGVPFPVKVDINARIVSLVAGGWSFEALDDAGRIYVWGQLQGEGYALNADGFSEPSKCAKVPHRLKVTYPAATTEASSRLVRFTSMTCGRAHNAALDAENNAWLFTSWGRPIQLTSPLIHNTGNPDEAVIQVECGWGFVSTLSKNGTVTVLWPWTVGEEFERALKTINETMDEQGGHKANAIDEDGEKVIPCTSVAISVSPLVLPPIPDNLPELDPTPEAFEPALDASGKIVEARHRHEGVRLVRIGAGDNFLIGLTNKGHVLSMDLSGGGESEPQGSEWLREQWRSRRRQGWVYLPQYSEVDQVKQNPVFAEGTGVPAPSRMKITHIAAHFNSFTAYSVGTNTSPHASLVLLGKKDTAPLTGELAFPQTIYPSLLKESIISLQLGDYHHAALTSTGKLYTWGSYSDGALGLGDPAELPLNAPGGYKRQEDLNAAREGRHWVKPEGAQDPSLVRFDHLMKTATTTKDGAKKSGGKFVISVAASGWHTGALVIDLDGSTETEEENVKLKGKEVEPDWDDDEGTFNVWRGTSGIPVPVPEPFPLPRTGVPHTEGTEHHESDPYSTFESPPFNPGAASANVPPGGRRALPRPPYTNQGPIPPIRHGPVIQPDSYSAYESPGFNPHASGNPGPATSSGNPSSAKIHIERGKGGLRGNTAHMAHVGHAGGIQPQPQPQPEGHTSASGDAQAQAQHPAEEHPASSSSGEHGAGSVHPPPRLGLAREMGRGGLRGNTDHMRRMVGGIGTFMPSHPPASHVSGSSEAQAQQPASEHPASSSSEEHGAGHEHPQPRLGLAAEMGRGGLRGNTDHMRRMVGGMGTFMPRHPPAGPAPGDRNTPSGKTE